MEITPAQARAARSMLRLSIAEVAKQAAISVRTLRNFESEKIAKPLPVTLASLKRALEALGIEFTNSKQPGVRFREAPKK